TGREIEMNTFSSFFAIILDATLKTTILLTLAWFATRMLKNRSSAARHLVRTLALCAVLLLPLLSALLPAWHVKRIPELAPTTEPKTRTATEGATVAFPEQPKASPQARASTRIRANHSKMTTSTVASAPQQQPPVFSTTSQVVAESDASPRVSANWPLVLGILWTIGAVIVGLRLLTGRLRLARLVRRAIPLINQGWCLQTREIARILGIRRHVALLESTETEVPLTSGALHPKIILPADYSEWSGVRRSAVLHHELAHIKRLDTLTQGIADCAI